MTSHCFCKESFAAIYSIFQHQILYWSVDFQYEKRAAFWVVFALFSFLFLVFPSRKATRKLTSYSGMLKQRTVVCQLTARSKLHNTAHTSWVFVQDLPYVKNTPFISKWQCFSDVLCEGFEVCLAFFSCFFTGVCRIAHCTRTVAQECTSKKYGFDWPKIKKQPSSALPSCGELMYLLRGLE